MKSYAKAMVFAAAAVCATAANATISVSAVQGNPVYSGPPVTFDFDTPATTPVTISGGIVGPGTTPNAFAQPIGSSGQYYSVGPSTFTPGTVLLGVGAGMQLVSLSFIWGSIDTWNSFHFTDAAGHLLAGSQYNFTGTQIAALVPAAANGSQVLNAQNPVVTFLFSGLDQTLVRGFQMSSRQNAFEIDNIAVAAVPEPSTWAMMLLGFGAIAFSIRRRKTVATLTQLA